MNIFRLFIFIVPCGRKIVGTHIILTKIYILT